MILYFFLSFTLLLANIQGRRVGDHCEYGKTGCTDDGRMLLCGAGKKSVAVSCGAGTVCTVVNPSLAVCGWGSPGGNQGGTQGGGNKGGGNQGGGHQGGGKQGGGHQGGGNQGGNQGGGNQGAGNHGGGSNNAEFVNAVQQGCRAGDKRYVKPTQEQYKYGIQNAKKNGDISSKRELAMFLAEILWESDCLTAKKEHFCQVNMQACRTAYEQSPKYPNNVYYGRGYIQLTHIYNYKPASQALFGNDKLVRNPDLVSDDESIAWATAHWFWKDRVRSDHGVQRGQFGSATKKINGGLECDRPSGHGHARKRFQIYKAVFKAFGVAGSPIERGCYN